MIGDIEQVATFLYKPVWTGTSPEMVSAAELAPVEDGTVSGGSCARGRTASGAARRGRGDGVDGVDRGERQQRGVAVAEVHAGDLRELPFAAHKKIKEALGGCARTWGRVGRTREALREARLTGI